ncbi:type II restriction endonuclease [Neisseria leonii]|uniref:Type II restriction endonuclease n=1 Tax=Neisseria leonii TaxID=2995413 RepID=A0A9X4E2D3_9NEIS|nr:type II restriction endonuclease [Neisseria sp. 51.81]MDD9328312.1 type II restriction endonuclease [Neisseria sp. 51.81]
MSDLAGVVVEVAEKSAAVYCRYIRANDVGATGSHQSGFYIQKHFSRQLFDTNCVKGENQTVPIVIEWQDGTITNSNFKYYGQCSRNEARITGFGRGFEFLGHEYSGSLLVLCRISKEDLIFKGFVLSADEDIDRFIAETGCFPGEVFISDQEPENEQVSLFNLFPEFPKTEQMAQLARSSILLDKNKTSDVLMQWIAKEYKLFAVFEKRDFDRIKLNISDIDSFIHHANSFTNRRKARAGKSLELHLAHIFEEFLLKFSQQAKTEGKKKPDFLFPGGLEYHAKDENGLFIFESDKLTMLGSKTTCKDRWRQVLNEADRIPNKHLFTLQEGISDEQIREMTEENLTLVVPKNAKNSFGVFGRTKILTLEEFIHHVQRQQIV